MILALVAMALAIGTGGSSPAIAQSSLLFPEVVVEPPALVAGVVEMGSSTTMELRVRNLSKRDSLLIERMFLIEGNAGFLLPQAGSMIIQPEDTVRLLVTFRPIRGGVAHDELILILHELGSADTIDTVSVQMYGEGRNPVIRLDTVSGVAGELVALTLRGLKGPFPAGGQGDLRIGLHFDPRALFPKEARILPNGDQLFVNYAGDGRLGLRFPELTGDSEIVVGITFRGLSTGQAENIVQIDSVALSGNVLPITGDGMVVLSGCDIEHELKMGRRVSALAVQHDPASAVITVTYHAPQGSVPLLRIYDLSGDCRLDRPLPEATDATQTIQIPVNMLGRGFYLLELLDRAERDILPLMIAR
jgi:hypothetical protein